MRHRLEREKETSIKELQKQSIEYEKKLGTQLEEKNTRYDIIEYFVRDFDTFF